MKEQSKNVRVLVENREGEAGFNIYLEFSGRREYLMTHRRSGLLYGLLKDGASLSDMRRWKPSEIMIRAGKNPRNSCNRKLVNTVDHLLLVIDDYMMEMAV
ncbi:MAG: hypothetical protein K6F17_07890 [Lachnospiraceae bacterium]|nr:hypothetical protein [Lachnospiraceae bacterium]